MKFNLSNKNTTYKVIFCILIITFDQINTFKNINSSFKSYNPSEIEQINDISNNDSRISIDLTDNDPLESMKRKEEIIRLFMKKPLNEEKLNKKPQAIDNKSGRFRFKTSDAKFTTLPTAVGNLGPPISKEYHAEEEVIHIIDVGATSNYVDKKEVFGAERTLSNDNRFWCSAGNHELDAKVDFIVSFEKSFRVSSYWIHWAFAPGKYRLYFANNKNKFSNEIEWGPPTDWTDSVQGGNENWWKSIITNPKTRWKYKSFDVRQNFDEPIWAKYFKLELALPVNQYFGLYKIEFYMLSKAVVMLKSLKLGEDICLSVVNGQFSNYSPVLALDCLQAISYGDNRDLFVLQSNGFITTYNGNKCLESSSADKVDIVDCGIASDYKDEREKWIMDPDGKIRSQKEQFTCLSITDFSVKDYIPISDITLTASSNQGDGVHGPEKAMGDDINAFWASIPSNSEVVFELNFKYTYIIKDMTIEWKFPAKSFKILGRGTDNYWKVFKKEDNNGETVTTINLMNKDLMGLKFIMIDSSTKVDEKSLYGIKNIYLHTGGRYLRRDPCKSILSDANKFEIIDVTTLDQVTGNEYKKAGAELHKTRTNLKIFENNYLKVPDELLRMKSTSANLGEKLKMISSSVNDMHLKLIKFEEFLKEENLQIFTIATSEYLPVNDCAHIIKAYPSKRSGMYWIKNECMNAPQRVYCDFDSYDFKGGLDYLIFNDNQTVNTPFKDKFKGFLDIRYKCYQLGMAPIEIKNQKMLDNIYYLLKIFKYDLKSPNIIPFAYDYNCDISKCAGIFKSLNGDSASDITDIMASFKKQKGDGINNLFETGDISDTTVKNIAGFGKIQNIVYEKLNKAKISAIVCSTNKDGSKMKKEYIDIECDTNLRSDNYSSYEIYSNLRMICPSDCAKVKKATIYGTGVYSDNSSVCRAAVHSGVIKDSEGGIVEVHFEPGQSNYLGSDHNEVSSLDFAEKWDKSFKVQRYNPYCPRDMLKEYSQDVQDDFINNSSFLELGNENDEILSEESNLDEILLKKTKKLELIKQIEDAISNFQHLTDQDRSLINDKKHMNIVEKLGTYSRYLQTSLGNGDEIKSLVKHFTGPGMLNKMRMASITKSENQNKNPINNKHDFPITDVVDFSKIVEQTEHAEQERIKSFLGASVPASHSTTEDALTYMLAMFNKEFIELTGIKKVSDKFKAVVGTVEMKINNLNADKEIGVTHQKEIFIDLKSKTSSVLKLIFEIDTKIQNKLKRTEFKLHKAKDMMNRFLIREPFQEDYTKQLISENWETYNSKKGKGQVPVWDYFQYNIDGHSKVIKMKGEFQDNRSGAHLILKDRDFYDFEFKCSVLLKGNNTFGFVFRYKDPYNYYIFEMSHNEGGYIRVRKFGQGSGKLIDIKTDGGFNQESWINIKIRAQQSYFQIFTTEYNGPDLEKHYEPKFTFVDNELVHGTFAFSSMGMEVVLIDNISATPIGCTNFDEAEGTKTITLTPTCTRFAETYRNGFNSRWKSVDPVENLEGPSIWKTVAWVEDRERVLTQQSMISSSNEFQEGTMFILTDLTKVCTYGRFIIKLKALDEGIVGLVFRYDNGENTGNTTYYILEVSGNPHDKFVRLRKKVDGKFELISSNPILGYNLNSWFRIILTMRNDSFNAFITEGSSQDSLVQVFQENLKDNDLKFGSVGISTYKTRVIIDEINLSPFDNMDIKSNLDEEILYVDEEALERKILCF